MADQEKFDPKRTTAQTPDAKAEMPTERPAKPDAPPSAAPSVEPPATEAPKDAAAKPAAEAEKPTPSAAPPEASGPAEAETKAADEKPTAETAIEKAANADPTEGEGKKHLAVVSEAQLTKPPTGNVVAQGWLVILLAAGFGSGLAALERTVGPTIAQNKLNETLEQVPSLVPGSTHGTADDDTIPGKRVFRALDNKDQLVGWVVNGKGQGFADKIELIIGLDAQAQTVTGVFVLDQKETPALGDNITTEDFRSRFVGIATSLTLDAKAGAQTNQQTGVIKALTGATISSDAVCTIINQTVASMKAELAAAATPVALGENQ